MTTVAALLIALACPAPADEADAEAVARRLLATGSDRFDARDAEALAATYTDDAEVVLYSRTEDSGLKADARRGRPAILSLYREIFANPGPIRSTNTVEFARFAGPDVLIILGRFAPKADGGSLPFVQVRTRDEAGTEWRIRSLQLFLVKSPPGPG